MSSRAWNGDSAPWIVVAGGLLLVFFVSYTAFYSQGYQTAHQDREADYEAYHVAEEAYRECLTRPGVEEALRCYAEAEKASRDDYRAERDLNAQREMADWAKWMFWATTVVGAFTVGVAAIGVHWVRETLRATTRLTEAQLRAYLVVKEISARHEFSSTGEKVGIAIKLVLFNGGATPAVDIGRQFLITENKYAGQSIIIPAGKRGERNLVEASMEDQVVADLAPSEPWVVYDKTLHLGVFASYHATGHVNCGLSCTVRYRPVVSKQPYVLSLDYWIRESPQTGAINISRKKPRTKEGEDS